MRTFMQSLLTTAVVATALGAVGSSYAQDIRVLAFSKTAGFRHASIDTGHATLTALGTRYGFDVVRSDDAAAFTPAGLATFDVVVFLNTTGNVLDGAQQSALEAFIRGGGGWVGVHAAADTEYDWPFYGTLLGNGAWFNAHPPIQTATVLREDATHPASAHFPFVGAINDEWYNFRVNPRPQVDVLLRLDEGSYSPGAGAMGADHPIAWAHSIDQGRAFYTGIGHRSEVYALDDVQRHLAGAILWTANRPFETLFVDGFETMFR